MEAAVTVRHAPLYTKAETWDSAERPTTADATSAVAPIAPALTIKAVVHSAAEAAATAAVHLAAKAAVTAMARSAAEAAVIAAVHSAVAVAAAVPSVEEAVTTVATAAGIPAEAARSADVVKMRTSALSIRCTSCIGHWA